mmetsp:Transcript_23180/g.20562  ORF Transcript_23180/g.20562 Transcript_23180/m.20562 type:complete len:152 (+) Transcript_23180:91-546(+)
MPLKIKTKIDSTKLIIQKPLIAKSHKLNKFFDRDLNETDPILKNIRNDIQKFINTSKEKQVKKLKIKSEQRDKLSKLSKISKIIIHDSDDNIVKKKPKSKLKLKPLLSEIFKDHLPVSIKKATKMKKEHMGIYMFSGLKLAKNSKDLIKLK